jgi:hypothetical protein
MREERTINNFFLREIEAGWNDCKHATTCAETSSGDFCSTGTVGFQLSSSTFLQRQMDSVKVPSIYEEDDL